MKPYGVKVTISVPPSTDTPGYIMEEENVPLETRLISKSAGLASPEKVAVQMLDDAIVSTLFTFYTIHMVKIKSQVFLLSAIRFKKLCLLY